MRALKSPNTPGAPSSVTQHVTVTRRADPSPQARTPRTYAQLQLKSQHNPLCARPALSPRTRTDKFRAQTLTLTLSAIASDAGAQVRTLLSGTFASEAPHRARMTQTADRRTQNAGHKTQRKAPQDAGTRLTRRRRGVDARGEGSLEMAERQRYIHSNPEPSGESDERCPRSKVNVRTYAG